MNSDRTEGAGMIEALAWLEVNKKRLAIGAVVLLVVGFGIYVYNYMGDQREINASSALISLRPAPTGSTNEPPIPASAYLKVAQDFAGTRAAQRALILAGGAYFTDGKYTEAQNTFDRLIKENPSSNWAADAAFGIAASLESEGKRDEALTAYQRVVTGFANSPVANEARMAEARIYESKNQFAEALNLYDDVTRGGMSSMRSQDAALARSQLLKKHPELEKKATNAAPAMSVTAGGTNKPAVLVSTNMSPMTNKAASGTNKAAALPKK
jgi:tetratricopeptide (TPR) repeat protein